jgi:hypothetical protein
MRFQYLTKKPLGCKHIKVFFNIRIFKQKGLPHNLVFCTSINYVFDNQIIAMK